MVLSLFLEPLPAEKSVHYLKIRSNSNSNQTIKKTYKSVDIFKCVAFL